MRKILFSLKQKQLIEAQFKALFKAINEKVINLQFESCISLINQRENNNYNYPYYH